MVFLFFCDIIEVLGEVFLSLVNRKISLLAG